MRDATAGQNAALHYPCAYLEVLAVADIAPSRVVIADLSLTSFSDCAVVCALVTAGSYAARTGAELRTFEPIRLGSGQRGPP